MRRAFTSLSFLVAVAVALPQAAEAKKKCRSKGKKPEVFVTGKTPVRRGPGLNYPVASFLERGVCAPYSEVSLDKSWVLVDIDDKLGWVPTSRLSAKSRQRISGVKVETAPVGSGQRRGYASITRQTVMLEAPRPDAPARRVAPQGVEVLPLAKTEDGKWIQIRDERGDVGWVAVADIAGKSLADLPNADESTIAVAPPPGPTSTSTAGGSTSGGGTMSGGRVVGGGTKPAGAIRIGASVFGAALLPLHSLDSDGVDAVRRYDVSSFTPGTGVEISLPELGPISLRANYVIGFLVGVEPENAPAVAVTGTQHDAALRIGFPVDAGSVLLTPEVGYAFGMFSFGSLLPGRVGTTFLSTQTHAGTAGARVQAFVTPSVMLEGDASVLLGFTSEGPLTLGDSGMTFGGVAAAGVQIAVADNIGIMARYALNYRTTSYSGQGTLDETIGEATLVDFTHGALAGMTFTFDAE